MQRLGIPAMRGGGVAHAEKEGQIATELGSANASFG
jgi:hypothetical protein